jgi:hypothetical protein
MIAVDGFKYVFGIINSDNNDELIGKAYSTLTLISKKNEMISLVLLTLTQMISYNITDVILRNLDPKYRFISHLLYLTEMLIDSD